MTIDSTGIAHQPAGSPTGGQFAAKSNTPPPAGLTESEAPPPVRARRGASMNRADFGAFGMKAVHTMPGWEGEAFTATLILEGNPVGTVHQEGRGGGTWCQFHAPGARAQFEQMVFDNWDFDRSYLTTDGESMELPHDDESVLDALYVETSTRAQLNRDRSRGRLPVMTGVDLARVEEGDGLHSYGALPGRANDPAAAAEDLRASGDLAGALYWDGEAWVPFEA